MKKAIVNFNDEHMLDGAKAAAKADKMTFHEYVTRLIAADLEKRLGYRIVIHYDNAPTKEETNFYTVADLMMSVQAYKEAFRGRVLVRDRGYITGYEVYQHNELMMKEGE